MNEFFDPLPPGSLRLSRSYLERSGRAMERASRVPYGFASNGAAGETPAGPWSHIDLSNFIFAEILAQPSEGYPGYSFIQRRPVKRDAPTDSGWGIAIPAIRGDNGSQAGAAIATVVGVSRTDNIVSIATDAAHGFVIGETVTVADLAGAGSTLNGDFPVLDTPSGTSFTYRLPGADIAAAIDDGTATRGGRPRSSPAYDMNGDDEIAVGTHVVLVKGYLHTSATNAADLSLVDAMNPDGGVTTDTEAAINQEWLILGGGSAIPTTAYATIHVTGKPQNTTPGPRRWYPAAVSETDPATWVRADGASVKLLQIKDAPLATDGPGYYVAKRLAGTVTFEDVDYPVYETDQRLRLLDVECNDDGTISVVTEGTFEGDADPGSAPYGGYDFSSVDDSAFDLLFWV